MARPIVLGVSGESAELVREARCGIVVTPEDPAEIVDAMRKLAGDADLARSLGENGRRIAERSFSRRAAATRMLGVLSDVVAAVRRP
jgi:glycosyltransferase involved in cell wall biosynthesis